MTQSSPADLAPGAHACLHFADETSRREVLESYFLAGVHQGHKLLYLSDEGRQDDVTQLLAPHLDPSALLSSGQLQVGNAVDAYLAGGYFDLKGCVGSFRQLAASSAAEGYPCLRVYADNHLVLPKLASVADWVDYELAIGQMTPQASVIGVCGFDGNAPLGLPVTVLDAVHQHSVGSLSRPSPYWLYGGADGATSLGGELDGFSADQAAELLGKAVSAASTLTVDLSGLSFIDAAGASTLFRAAVTTKGLGYRNAPAMLATIWEAVGYASIRPLESVRPS